MWKERKKIDLFSIKSSLESYQQFNISILARERFTFGVFRQFFKHLRKRSVPKQNLKYCDVCKKGFATQISLLLHQKTHEDVNLSFQDDHESSGDVSMSDKETYVRCDECSKPFSGRKQKCFILNEVGPGTAKKL